VKLFIIDPADPVTVRDKDITHARSECALNGGVHLGREQTPGTFVILSVGISVHLE